MDPIFVKSVLVDKIKVKPRYINKNIASYLLLSLKTKFEGKCTHHGFIKPGSISIVKYSLGNVLAVSLNGDMIYHVQFIAKICNPSINTIIDARVVNTNKFGILAEYSIESGNSRVPILEIIIAKNATDKMQELESIKTNDNIKVKVIGKKFELNDKKISVVGSVVFDDEYSMLMKKDEVSIIDNDNDNDDVDELQDDLDGVNDEEEPEEDESGEENDNEDKEFKKEDADDEVEGEDDEDDEADDEELFDDEEDIFSENEGSVASSVEEI